MPSGLGKHKSGELAVKTSVLDAAVEDESSMDNARILHFTNSGKAVINGHHEEIITDVKWPAVPDGTNNEYQYASVACAEKTCSKIGVQILSEGGSAVDAAIATSLCIGVARSISSGVGGGGFMTYYNRTTQETVVLDYRETAPKAAFSTMYENSNLSAKFGGGAIGVPGEVAGLWEAHQRFGKLPWSRLFQPAIQMAENGVVLNSYVNRTLATVYQEFDEELKQIFTDPATGKMKKVGDTIVYKKLGRTLRRIAEHGPETFYSGDLRDDIIADLEELDGQIVMSDDLEDYKVEIKKPFKSTLKNGGYTLISAPSPSGGPIVQYILKLLDGYHFTKDSVSPKQEDIKSTSTTYHRIVEAMKFAYGARMNLGDPTFVNIDEAMRNMTDPEIIEKTRRRITDDTTHDVEYYGLLTDARNTTGTSHMSILAANGDAVSVTTSVNSPWGAKRMGKRTGIIFNNIMDDFSLPGVPSWRDDAWVAPSNSENWIQPGKKPLSAMSPTIITDEMGAVVLVTGGSGGAQIISATSLTIINNLWLGMNLTEAIPRPRLHHQLLPEVVLYEAGFPQEYLNELRKKNHQVLPLPKVPVTDSVSHRGGKILGVGDLRRLGGSDGF